VKRNVGEAWGKEIERLLRVEILPKLGEKQIGMIKKAHILDLLDAIVDRGSPITANRAFAVLRQLFNWATDRDLIEVSPMPRSAPAPEQARDRVLSDEEIHLVWRAFDQIGWRSDRSGSSYFLLAHGVTKDRGANSISTRGHGRSRRRGPKTKRLMKFRSAIPRWTFSRGCPGSPANPASSVLDDAAFGARYTAAADKPAVYAPSDNYLIDLKHAVIMDVEATTAIRQAEVSAAKTMLDRTAEQFEVAPSRLVADAGYGSAEMIGWLVDERGIEPHVKLMDKSERTDGTFSREPTSPSIQRATSMSVPPAKS
jgi:hypothetical protein